MKKLTLVTVVVACMLSFGLMVGCSSGSSSGKADTSSSSSSSSAASSSSSSSDKAAVSAQDFMLVNSTDADIYGLYISPTNTDSWEEDVLGQDVLADGASVSIHFPATSDAQYWDLMVTDVEGTQIEFKNIDLFSASTITLTIEDGNPQALLS